MTGGRAGRGHARSRSRWTCAAASRPRPRPRPRDDRRQRPRSPDRLPYVAVVGARDAGRPAGRGGRGGGRRSWPARGAVVVCGGLGGVMEAACRGAKAARRHHARDPPGRRPRGRQRLGGRRARHRAGRGPQRARGPRGRRAGGGGRRLRHAVRDRAGPEGGQAACSGSRRWDIPARGGRSPRRTPRPPPWTAAYLDSPVPPASQSDTPYLDALRAYAPATRGASTCRATRAGPAPTRALREAIGPARARPRHPGAHVRHRRGRGAHAVRAGAGPGRGGLGGPAHLVPGERRVAGQPRGAARARAPAARAWSSSATRTRAPSTRCVLVRAAPDVRGARARPRAAHRALHDARRARPGAAARPRTPSARRSSRPPTSARWPTWPRWPRWPTRTACRWWWTRRGARTSPSTRTCRGTRSSLGADLVVSSTHKIVGSLTQSAMVHLGHGDLIERGGGGPLRHPRRVHEPELAAERRRSTRPGARRGARAASCSGETLAALAARARRCARSPGLDVLDERLAGAPGVFAYDPLRLAIDVRGTGASGYELARLVRERDDVNLELAGRERDGGGVRHGRGRGGRGRRGWSRRCAAPWTPSARARRTARTSRSRRRRPGASSR